jgi:opacity protein-like surface antigen
MKITKSMLLAALLLSSVAITAGASESIVYGALDVTQGSTKDACTSLPPTITCSTSTTAYRLGLGFQFNRFIGLEASYLFPAKLTASGTYLTIPVSGEVSVSGYQLSILGALPIGDHFSLLAKAGYASTDASESISGFGYTLSNNEKNVNPAYGLGARFAFNDRFALRIMYEDLGIVKTASMATGTRLTFVNAGLQIGF